MKYLLVLLVVVVGLWLLLGRSRGRGARSAEPSRKSAGPKTDVMVSCAHCGLHLPQSESVADAAGRPFCSDAHRLGGPR